MQIRKTQSHGKIGEAAVTAKCWMYGIPAYNTAGLRANFAGSDILVDTADPTKKLLVQVKTGYSPSSDNLVYLTQCSGEEDLAKDKFVSDFLVFVNIDRKVGQTHNHNGELDFWSLTFYVVPRLAANQIYKAAVHRSYARPLRSGGIRKLGNMNVDAFAEEMQSYKNAWFLIREASSTSSDHSTLLAEPKLLDLFDVAPISWGLRGDPYLWEEMKETLVDIPLPQDENLLTDVIEKTFKKLTGASFSSSKDFWVERYNHGGMSSGYVCVGYWRDEIIPLLHERFKAILHNEPIYSIEKADQIKDLNHDK